MTIAPISLDHLEHVAITAARVAGALLRNNFDQTKQLRYKEGVHNIVTDSDLAAEQRILGTIRSAFPTHAVLAEEAGSQSASSPYRWIVDPLDGTVNFAHGVPIFSVSIAVEFEGAVVVGVVYHPMLDELFSARRGQGAFLNGKRLEVSSCAELADAFLVTGFPYNIASFPEYSEEHFAALVRRGIPIRRLGSAALDLAYVAAGRFDGFWEVGLHPWDIAAGTLLITEAGGTVSAYDGSPHTLDTRTIVASNGRIHRQLVEFLTQHQR
ncbi:MAG: inositol monophosphatase [Candidatus Kapaibacterium sp.]|nr:MAG: inositol monophosphatase [Candidatus Kapabacteria bacterium]